MKKLTQQNSELIQKWTRDMAADLADQEDQMAERLNEQRMSHQNEVEELQTQIGCLEQRVSTLTAEVQMNVAQKTAQTQELAKIKSDATVAVAHLRNEITQLKQEHQKVVQALEAENRQMKIDQSMIHAELRKKINETIELSKENEEIEKLLNDVSAELATKNIEINESQGWIEHMAKVNQDLEQKLAAEQASAVQLKAKLAESYQKILQEQGKNLAFNEKLKRNAGVSSEIPQKALEAIETSQKLKALVEEERNVFDRVTQELNRRIAKLESEKENAFKLIEEVKSVSTVEELSERIKAFQMNTEA